MQPLTTSMCSAVSVLCQPAHSLGEIGGKFAAAAVKWMHTDMSVTRNGQGHAPVSSWTLGLWGSV
jgi:hypothetical protein